MIALATLAVAATVQAAAPTLKYDPPAGWVSKPTSSSMRVAEFALPRAAPEEEDGSLSVYYFGGTGGSAQANLDRWIGQMAQADGKPSREVAQTSTMTSNGFRLTLVDVSGTYVAEKAPGSAERYNKPGFRLRAAVLEGNGGPFFVKLVGPAKTLAKWEASYVTFLKSLRPE